jgi:hypothetical protein
MLAGITPIFPIAHNARQSAPAFTLGLNLVLDRDGQVPEWIELIPAGRNVQGVDDRAWINDQPQRRCFFLEQPLHQLLYLHPRPLLQRLAANLV